MKTFAQFRSAVISRIFPEGEPENLVEQHTRDLVSAMLDLQHWIPRLLTKNTSTHRMCASYFYCGATMVPAPRGKIQSVYTLDGNANCCPIFYDYIESYDRFLGWLRQHRGPWTNPEQPAGLPPLSGGSMYAGTATNKGRRYNWGNWALHNGRIYAGHRLESSEILCIDWKGKKRRYSNDDILNFGGDIEDPDDDGIEIEEAIGMFVLSKHNTLYAGDPVNGSRLMLDYYDKRAKLLHKYRDEEIPEAKPEREYDQPVVVSGCRAQDCTPTDETGSEMFFVMTGDIGVNLEASASVATLIESWGPEFIVSVGDNWNNGSSPHTTANLDYTFGQFYRTFIHPYRGTSGADVATEQRYFGAIGNHDRDPEPRLDLVRSFLNLPPSNGEPCRGYYDFKKGDVHFFMMDGGFNNANVNAQPDGVTSDSIQAQWLRSGLESSKSRWKIVVCHQTPYTSYLGGNSLYPFSDDGFRAYTDLRWPFKEWGADIVVCGHVHNYERLIVSGFTFLNTGNGGSGLAAIDEDVLSPYSVKHNVNWGATKVYATCDYLSFQHYDINGVLIDQFSITKESGVTVPAAPSDSGYVIDNIRGLAYNPATGLYHRLLLDTDETTGALQIYPDPNPV